MSGKTKCLVHNSDINIPCRLTECPLFVNNKHFLNCINHYMRIKEIDGLSPYDVGFLMDIPQSEVASYIKNGLDVLRSQAVVSGPTGLSSNFDVVLEFADHVDPISEVPCDHNMSFMYVVEAKFRNHFVEAISHLRPSFSDFATMLKALGLSKPDIEVTLGIFDLQ